ncbi:MAG: type II toxin-antitoxin system PemK/MazF family toxin [Thermomicrobiales bacterium]
MSDYVLRGEVWDVDFDPVVGHAQGGRRPALIVSNDRLHAIPSALVTILPITTRDRGIRAHVRVAPPEGGLTAPTVVITEQVRTISRLRLVRRRGAVSEQALATVERRLRYFLDL